MQTIKKCFTKKERSLREKKKEIRKGGLEQFFSHQAALPRLFLGRIPPKKAACHRSERQNWRSLNRVTEISSQE
jgi:hypothetical protein